MTGFFFPSIWSWIIREKEANWRKISGLSVFRRSDGKFCTFQTSYFFGKMPRKVHEHKAVFFIKMGNWRQILIHFSISSILMDKIEEMAKISIFVLIYKRRYSITDVPTPQKVNKNGLFCELTATFTNLNQQIVFKTILSSQQWRFSRIVKFFGGETNCVTKTLK